MTIDVIESVGLDKTAVDLSGKMSALRKGFESSLESKFDAYMDVPESVDGNISRWIGVDPAETAADLAAIRDTAMDTAKRMYSGIEYEDGFQTTGLKEIANYKVNPEYATQNLKQHAGYAAEVIGTAKENIQAKLDETGVKTFRTDDRPDLFQRNDQYVDKIRVNDAGEIVERIQVKFVGKDAADCLAKLTSKKYDKYFTDGMVDKMEVPKDYYPEMKRLIPEKISNLEEQLQHVKENGNTEAQQNIENKIAKFKQIDEMLEQSTVSSDEALEAVKHPKRYTAKLFAQDTFAESHKAGKESAALAATITAAVSTVDNVGKVMEGEITPQEAFVDVAKDTGVAGGVAYGTVFVSTAVAQTMSASSHELIKSLGGSGVPAAVVSVSVQSFDSVIDYADGTIDGKELAYDLGENVAAVGGSIAGGAIAGAAVGSVVPGAGTVVGFTAGLVGSMVGCAIASEAYASAVEFGAENADALADKAKEMANKTVEIATDVVPNKVGNIVASLNHFATVNNLPFRV